MEPSKTLLQVQNLRKSYHRLKAVDDVSFSIQEGEIIGLLGPNGAGKTTIIHILLGLLAPDSGSVQILGKDLSRHKSEILSQMNFAAGYTELPANLKVKENLLVYALLYNVPDPRQAVQKMMRKLNLDQYQDKKTGLFSSGERSRLLLAKALLNNPKLLLLDEPTSSLDPAASQAVCSLLQEYARGQKASILWASHDMEEVEKVCDRILFLSRGKLVLEGRPKELPAEYGTKNLEELFIFLNKERAPALTHNP